MLPLITLAALCHAGAAAAVDPRGRGAWIADASADAVLLVTPRAGVETFPGCVRPSQLVVDSAGVAYVSCRGAGEVRRLESGRAAAVWPAGSEPAALAVGSRKSDVVQVLSAELSGVVRRLRVPPPLTATPVSVGVDRFVPAGDGILLLAPRAETGRIEEPTYYGSENGAPVTYDLLVLDAASRFTRVRNLRLPDVSGAALAGRDIAHTGPYGWDGNYERLEDYIDFTIRQRMFGYGLPKADLRALARYVREGLRPVTRPASTIEQRVAVQRGRVVFHAGAGCSTCHGADGAFTDGTMHDVGSLRWRERAAWQSTQPLVRTIITPAPASRDLRLLALLGNISPGGQVAGQLRRVSVAPTPVPAALRQFDTPSLLQAGLTAPYLHDGSARTLEEVFAQLGDHMGSVSALTSRERGDLVAYLQTL